MAREAREKEGYEMREPYVAKRVLKGMQGAQVPSCSGVEGGRSVFGEERRKGEGP